MPDCMTVRMRFEGRLQIRERVASADGGLRQPVHPQHCPDHHPSAPSERQPQLMQRRAERPIADRDEARRTMPSGSTTASPCTMSSMLP